MGADFESSPMGDWIVEVNPGRLLSGEATSLDNATWEE